MSSLTIKKLFGRTVRFRQTDVVVSVETRRAVTGTALFLIPGRSPVVSVRRGIRPPNVSDVTLLPCRPFRPFFLSLVEGRGESYMLTSEQTQKTPKIFCLRSSTRKNPKVSIVNAVNFTDPVLTHRSRIGTGVHRIRVPPRIVSFISLSFLQRTPGRQLQSLPSLLGPSFPTVRRERMEPQLGHSGVISR